MSIKSDKWIRRQAAAGMIEPFEPGQVRHVDGKRIVSYGTSSYGYDVRCANEFKIFTNINSTIVDPKAFDPQSFVDVQSDVCIIPPNSFALARTVEYFRIPRSTLVVCLGKSTYARCFSGDTRVALANGTSASLEDMARRADQGEEFFGYSIGAHGRLIVSRLEMPRYIGRDSLLEIELDDGAVIRATPDHLFLTRDGRMVPAGDLRPLDSLMPLYRHQQNGHEMVYQPLTGQLHATRELSDEWNVRNGMYAPQSPSQCRHVDANRLNNYPSNITRAEALEVDRDGAESALMARPYERMFGHGARRLRRIGGASQAVRNHKVAAIRPVAGDHDVYCLTVPEAGNFALEAGVFVHNCGIIVNVTPLEPEWEGHVTLEFSNTTTLPAKIYANEGVAQMLFFESDEVCDTSYKDRGGKYQGQTGVTLPKT
jgi:deoxycytidine triphosphate deaminase